MSRDQYGDFFTCIFLSTSMLILTSRNDRDRFRAQALQLGASEVSVISRFLPSAYYVTRIIAILLDYR
jgi:hypothetical protein